MSLVRGFFAYARATFLPLIREKKQRGGEPRARKTTEPGFLSGKGRRLPRCRFLSLISGSWPLSSAVGSRPDLGWRAQLEQILDGSDHVESRVDTRAVKVASSCDKVAPAIGRDRVPALVIHGGIDEETNVKEERADERGADKAMTRTLVTRRLRRD